MNDDQSRLELRKGELYKPGSSTKREEIHGLTGENYSVPNEWGSATIEHAVAPVIAPPSPAVPTSIKVLRAFTAVVVAGALSAFGYLAYQLYSPGVRPSTDLIDVTIDAPVGVSPDKPAMIDISIRNRNNIALVGTEVTFELPDGAYLMSETGVPSPAREVKMPIGVVASGESVSRSVSAYILGNEQEEKKAAVLVGFGFFGVESKFSKHVDRTFRITGSPIVVSMQSLQRVSSGAPFSAVYTVKSNTVVPLSGLMFALAYPPGFVYDTAEPGPNSSNNQWMLPELTQGKTTEIIIRGAFAGDGAEERVLRAEVGTTKIDARSSIASVFAKSDSSIGIEAPFINAKISFDGSRGSLVAREGVRLNGILKLTNATALPIDHIVAELKIGGAYDSGSVDASMGGIYRAALANITWDERNDSRLASLLPGATISLSFSLAPVAPRAGMKPALSFTANVHAVRTNESGVSGDASTLAAVDIPLATQAEFTARAVHFSGPFKNDGPIPPKVDVTTKYTVIWSLRNTTNALEGGIVRATLAPAVEWMNIVDTEATSSMQYNSDTHQISWNVGKIAAGAGVGALPPKEISFQLALTPSLGMMTKVPSLLTGIQFTAQDAVTRQVVTQKISDIDVRLSGDPTAPGGAGVVGK